MEACFFREQRPSAWAARQALLPFHVQPSGWDSALPWCHSFLIYEPAPGAADRSCSSRAPVKSRQLWQMGLSTFFFIFIFCKFLVFRPLILPIKLSRWCCSTCPVACCVLCRTPVDHCCILMVMCVKLGCPKPTCSFQEACSGCHPFLHPLNPFKPLEHRAFG